MERADQGLSPLLTGEEAAALVRNGAREVGALSYGWLLPWDPDPTGERMVLLRRVLKERPYIKALFWDQATLYQLPRSQEEEEAFSRALRVMMDLYASAIGTTCVLCGPRLQPAWFQTNVMLARVPRAQCASDQGDSASTDRVRWAALPGRRAHRHQRGQDHGAASAIWRDRALHATRAVDHSVPSQVQGSCRGRNGG